MATYHNLVPLFTVNVPHADGKGFEEIDIVKIEVFPIAVPGRSAIATGKPEISVSFVGVFLGVDKKGNFRFIEPTKCIYDPNYL